MFRKRFKVINTQLYNNFGRVITIKKRVKSLRKSLLKHIPWLKFKYDGYVTIEMVQPTLSYYNQFKQNKLKNLDGSVANYLPEELKFVPINEDVKLSNIYLLNKSSSICNTRTPLENRLGRIRLVKIADTKLIEYMLKLSFK